MSELYSPDGVEPFLEYQSTSPHEHDRKDGYFPVPDAGAASVAWSRRKNVSSRSPSAEHSPPRPIFDAAGDDGGEDGVPPSSSPPSALGSLLLRRKSSKPGGSLAASSPPPSASPSPASSPHATRKPSAGQLKRALSAASRRTAAVSPVAQALVLPPSPPEHPEPGLHPRPPPPPAQQDKPQHQQQLQPPPALAPHVEQPTPPLTPEPPPTPALFQPPAHARPAPYAAVAGPPTRNAGSRRASEASSRTDAGPGSSPAFASAVGGGKAAAADLSNPWRAQTERPLDTVRRLSRQVDRKDPWAYQANRLSAYGAAAAVGAAAAAAAAVGRGDDDSSSSSSSLTPTTTTTAASVLAPPGSTAWASLPSTMNMTGPYPTAAVSAGGMVGPYPLPGRAASTPFALDASPWPEWSPPAASSAGAEHTHGRAGTAKRRTTSSSSGKRSGLATLDSGQLLHSGKAKAAASAGGAGSTYSRSPLSQASSPEPSSPPSPGTRADAARPPALGRTKSARRRLSFWRRKHAAGDEGESADVVPPLPARPAGVRMGKPQGTRERAASVEPRPEQQQQQPARGGRRAASEPAQAVPPQTVVSPPTAAAPAPKLSRPNTPTKVKSAPPPPPSPEGGAKTLAPPAVAQLKPTAAGGLGSLFRRISSFGRRGSVAPAGGKLKAGEPSSKADGGKAEVDEMGRQAVIARVSSRPPQQEDVPAPPSPVVVQLNSPASSSTASLPAAAAAGRVPSSTDSGRASPRAAPPATALPDTLPPQAARDRSPVRSAKSGSPGPVARALPVLGAVVAPDSAGKPERRAEPPVQQQQSAVPELAPSPRADPVPLMNGHAAAAPPHTKASPSPRRMSKKTSAISLLPAAPSSPAAAAGARANSPAASPHRVARELSPRNCPLPASPSPTPEREAFGATTGAGFARYAPAPQQQQQQQQQQQGKGKGLRKRASAELGGLGTGRLAAQLPPPLVRASSSPSASRPTTPPPSTSLKPSPAIVAATEHDASLSSYAAAADLPALLPASEAATTPNGQPHTPGSSSVATPNFWDPDAAGAVDGGLELYGGEAGKRLVSEV